jgi:hypothetical protein
MTKRLPRFVIAKPLAGGGASGSISRSRPTIASGAVLFRTSRLGVTMQRRVASTATAVGLQL